MADTGTKPWQVLGKRRIYASPWINLEYWDVQLPDGSRIPDHHVLDYPAEVVGVLPVGDDGRVLLIDHYRFITDTRGWEVPAGGLEPGEGLLDGAARELLEETGYAAGRWTVLGQYHPSNGSSNQVFHAVIGQGLTRQAEPTDLNETLGLRWFTLDELRELIGRNAIRDGLTLTTLCWALIARPALAAKGDS